MFSCLQEERKKFDKQTEKYCASVQNYLNLSSKKKESLLQEADAQLQMERRVFHQTALDYVFKLQEVNEKKKFEFVETVSEFVSVTSRVKCILDKLFGFS